VNVAGFSSVHLAASAAGRSASRKYRDGDPHAAMVSGKGRIAPIPFGRRLAMGARLITMLVLIYAGFSALGIAAGVSVVRKAGYSPWWVVTGLIPLVNVVMAFTFAFADWPVLQENRRAARRATTEKSHPSLGYLPAAPQFAPQVPPQFAPQFPPPAAAQLAPPPAPRPYGT
jgi:hypothetical protein